MVRRPVRGGAQRPHAAPSLQTPMSSSRTTPMSSTYPSTQTSEAAPETEVDKLDIASLTLDTPITLLKRPERRVPAKPFLFLELPSELRIKVYEHFFDDDVRDPVIDLSPANYKRFHRKLGIMRTCKQVRAEASHLFYGTRAFRIFPTYPGKYFKTKRPLLARLKPHQRQCLTLLELRLGPGWNAPPKGWAVTDALGLKDCANVKRLRIFVECDPSDGVFKGFRRSEGFYEGFSRQLLTSVVEALPAVQWLEFDAWSSVKKNGAMMQGLLNVANSSGRMICWGEERGWTDDMHEDDTPIKNPNDAYIQAMLDAGYAASDIMVSA